MPLTETDDVSGHCRRRACCAFGCIADAGHRPQTHHLPLRLCLLEANLPTAPNHSEQLACRVDGLRALGADLVEDTKGGSGREQLNSLIDVLPAQGSTLSRYCRDIYA